MGKVSACLKRSFITAVTVIGVISVLLLAITLFSHGYFHEQEELLTGLQVMYIISTVTLALAIIGVFGVCKKKQWALILFTVGMILSALFMFVCVSHGLAMKPQVVEELKRHYQDIAPLANTTLAAKERLNEAQMDLQCCGLDQGYVDWGYDIPTSCICVEGSTKPCVAAPRNSALYDGPVHDEPIMIYEESCLTYIIEEEIFYMNMVLGVMLGMTLLWVLSVVLCVVILCRLNRKDDTPTVVYSAEAKAGNYAVLTEPTEFT